MTMGISRSVMPNSKKHNALKGRHFTLVEMPALLYYTFFKHPAYTPNKQGPGFYKSENHRFWFSKQFRIRELSVVGF
jgi:hypothetical protein